ncbi:MAG: DNA repair protein RadC [Ruminococcus sp.]|nr:DNA repair protein RadC [Ruminococcus sp.]
MAENIHKGHRQRIRQKFMKTGFTAFADHEKLELLLFYAIPMKDTNPIAHNLLNRFKSIGGVFDATYEQLMEVDGISESTAVFLKLVPEMAKEYMLSENIHVCMDSTEAVCNFFSTQFIGDVNEKIKIACVDDRLRLICCETIAEGTPGSVKVDIRTLVKFTYMNNSESIIMAHNHPNGDSLPSDDDIRHTTEIYKKLRMVGINLIDHIVVAKGQATSLKSVGAFSLLK